MASPTKGARTASNEQTGIWIVWAGLSEASRFPNTLANELSETQEVKIFDVVSEHGLEVGTGSMFYYWTDLIEMYSKYTSSENPGVTSPGFGPLDEAVVGNPAALFKRYDRYVELWNKCYGRSPPSHEVLSQLQDDCRSDCLAQLVRISSGEDFGIALVLNDISDPSRAFRDRIHKFCKPRHSAIHEPMEDEDDSSNIMSYKQDMMDEQNAKSDGFDEEEDVTKMNEQFDNFAKQESVTSKIYYYDNQVIMGNNILERVKEIYKRYHGVNDLGERFRDVDFRIYTPRFNMLQNQTMARVCDFDAGVLPSALTDRMKRLQYARNRVRKYLYSGFDEEQHERLKVEVRDKPNTLFVIVADECHWGITQGEQAHNRLINDWNDEDHVNVIVLQVSATPYNLLTKNSRLPVVPYSPPLLGPAKGLTSESEDLISESLVCGSQELHLAHWSEVDMARLQTGATFKLKTSIPDETDDSGGVFWLRLSRGGYLETCRECDATLFSTEGLGKGFTKLYEFSDKPDTPKRRLYVEAPTRRRDRRIYASSDDVVASLAGKFEIVLDFGVGLAAIRSCADVSSYITVPSKGGTVSVETVEIRDRRLTRLMPKEYIFQLEELLCVKSFRRHDRAKTYLSLNYYFNTMNLGERSQIREDPYFQNLCKKRKDSDSSDALLVADYAYNMLVVSSAVACMESSSSLDSVIREHKRKLTNLRKAFSESLKMEKGCAISWATFDFVSVFMREKVVRDMNNSLKEFRKAQRTLTKPFLEDSKLQRDFAGSLAAVDLHFPEELESTLSWKEASAAIELFRQLQQSKPDWFVQYWYQIFDESETAKIVLDLVQNSREDTNGQLHGKMKILRVHQQKHGREFCRTLEIAVDVVKSEVGNVADFVVLRDFGGEKLEPQVRKCSKIYELIQRCRCEHMKSDTLEQCPCDSYQRSRVEGHDRGPRSFICQNSNCGHLHRVIDQYESLANVPCILILVEKGRMGDTFPHSFDCLDLRLMGSSASPRLSTLVQELGRLCRYVDKKDTVVPSVLLGKNLFDKLRKHNKECSLFSLDIDPGSYMTRYRGSLPDPNLKRSGSLRWMRFRATDDSYDHQNELQHKNRLLLQAEPQIGKTGAYLYFIQRLRQAVCQDEQERRAFEEYFEDEVTDESEISDWSPDTSPFDSSAWHFPYWKDMLNMRSITRIPIALGKYGLYDRSVPRHQQVKTVLDHFVPSSCDDGQSLERLLRQTDRKMMRVCTESRGTEENLLRAHCYSHMQTCADCAREEGNLADPQLRTSEISGIGKFRMSIPTTEVFQRLALPTFLCSGNFEDAREHLKWGDLNNKLTGLHHWIVHPSYKRARKAFLNYNHVMQETDGDFAYIQVVVVRECDFDAYVRYWGKTHMIIELPSSLRLPEKIRDSDLFPNDMCFVEKGGIGYCRLFIQLFAHALKLDNVFVLDDNIRFFKELDFEHPPQNRDAFFRGEGLKLVPFSHCLGHAEKQTRDIRLPQHLQKKPFKKHEPESDSLFSYSGPFSRYAALGFQKRPVCLQPFKRTQIYSALLLNVEETTKRNVYYRPLPCCEDLMFNDECDESRLWLCKYSRFVIGKVHFKDWSRGLMLHWKEDTALRVPVASDDPRVQEEPKKIVDFVKYITNDRMTVLEPLYRPWNTTLTKRYADIWEYKQSVFTDEGHKSAIEIGDKPLVIPWFIHDGTQSLETVLGLQRDYQPPRKAHVPVIFLVSAKLLCDNQISTMEGICSLFSENAGFPKEHVHVASCRDPEQHPIAVVAIWNESKKYCSNL